MKQDKSYLRSSEFRFGAGLKINITNYITTSWERFSRNVGLRLALLLSLVTLSVSICHAQSYNDCTDNALPIYSAWHFPDTVCSGAVVPFSIGYDTNNTMVLAPVVPKVSKPDTMFIPDGVPCNGSCVHSSPITVSGYSGTIQSPNDIKYVRLNIEHSQAADLYIYLECPSHFTADIITPGYNNPDQNCGNLSIPSTNYWPSSTAIKLNAKFGDAYNSADAASPCVSSNSLNQQGIGWNYCWSNNYNSSFTYNNIGYGYINNINGVGDLVALKFDSTHISAGTQFYHPEQDFGVHLYGCQINGEWTINIISAGGKRDKNGYLFDWEIVFEDSLAGPSDPVDSAAVLVPGNGSPDTWVEDTLRFARVTDTDTSFVFTAPVVTQNLTIEDALRVYDPVSNCWYDTTLKVVVLGVGDSTINATICHADLPYSVPGNGLAFYG